MIEQMSPLDALFLHVEDGVAHMHIGSCSIFAGPTPSIEDVTSLIESKLPQLQRYRQVVRFVPGGLGHPVWVDDPHFNLNYHVRHSALPAPGSEDDLERLMARLMSQELDRHRPLWEAWMVEGLSGGRWAIISKVHHCMVDGISGAGLLTVLLDADPTAKTAQITPWTPQPWPSDLELAITAAARLMSVPVRRALDWQSHGINAKRAWNRLGQVVSGLGSFGAQMMAPVALLSVEGDIGPHRRWAAARCTLDEVKFIRSALGGSVNDVVLAAISGAFRTVLIERGDKIDETTVLRSLIPVSLRSADDRTSNNQVSLIIAELPVGIADPRQRLHKVCEQMTELKSSNQATAGEAVLSASDLLPPMLISAGTHAVTRFLLKAPQRTINTVTTNVPGPQFPLYALGRLMLDYLPFVPLADGVRIGVAILSYNGQIAFGVTGDYDTAPDVHFMAERIEAEVKILLEHARRADRKTPGRQGSKAAAGERDRQRPQQRRQPRDTRRRAPAS